MANTWHLINRYISPHFHLFFDDLFDMIICQGDNDSTIEAIWSDIFDINPDWYAKEYFEDAGNLVYWPPPLHNVWLDEQISRDWRQEFEIQRNSTEDRILKGNREILEIITLKTNYDDDFSSRGVPISDDELSVDYYVGHPPSE